jgi:hypothetical protein
VHQSRRSCTTRPRPASSTAADAAQAGEQHCRGTDVLQQVVDRRDAAVGVAGRSVESEQRRRSLTIDGKPGAGDRAGAERIAIGRRERGAQARDVAFALLDDAQQIVRDGRRLGRLRVGVRCEHGLAMRVGQFDQDAPERQRSIDDVEHHLPLQHAVHGHVDVVARPRRVQTARDVGSTCLRDQPFDIKEEILAGPVEGCRANVVQHDSVECLPNPVTFVSSHDAALREHHEMRVVDGHERHEELGLRVLEVFVEDETDVLGRERHYRSPRLRRLAIKR